MLLLLLTGPFSSPAPPPPPLDHVCAYSAEDGTTIYIDEAATSFYVPEETDALCPELGGGTGWPEAPGERKRRRKALERLLRVQKDATFGRKWFAEFEAAQREYAEIDAEVALAVGARQAHQVAEEIEDIGAAGLYRPRLNEIAASLQMAAQARKNADVINAARAAEQMAAALRLRLLQEQDDEEAILLMLE